MWVKLEMLQTGTIAFTEVDCLMSSLLDQDEAVSTSLCVEYCAPFYFCYARLQLSLAPFRFVSF